MKKDRKETRGRKAKPDGERMVDFRFPVSIPPRLQEQLKREAAHQCMSMSGWVVQLVRKELERLERKERKAA